MKYVQGFVHSKLAREHYYLISNNFYMSILKEGKGQAELSTSDDYDKFTDTIELIEGSVICVRFFALNEYSTAYSYLESINDVIIKNETLISREFIERNPTLFVNVTTVIERDKKIDKILG